MDSEPGVDAMARFCFAVEIHGVVERTVLAFKVHRRRMLLVFIKTFQECGPSEGSAMAPAHGTAQCLKPLVQLSHQSQQYLKSQLRIRSSNF